MEREMDLVRWTGKRGADRGSSRFESVKGESHYSSGPSRCDRKHTKRARRDEHLR